MSTTSLLHIINGPCIGIPQTAEITSERLSNSTTTITNTTHLNGSLNVINNINYYGALPGPWHLITGPPCVANVTNSDHAPAMHMVGQGGHGILLTAGTSEDSINSSIAKPSNAVEFSDSIKEENGDVQAPCRQTKRSSKSLSQDGNTIEVSKKKRLNSARRADGNSIYHSSSLSTLKLGGSLSQLWAAAAASQSQLAGKAGLKSVE